MRAVRLVLTTDKSMAEVARDLGINYKTLGNWVRAEKARRPGMLVPGAINENERMELQRLRKENRRAEGRARDPPQGSRLFCQGDDPVSRFRFVSEYAGDYGVKRLCRVLGVSRSGYYAWAAARRPRAQARVELTTLITEIHRRSRTTYGAPGSTPSSGASTNGAPGSGWPPHGQRGPGGGPCPEALAPRSTRRRARSRSREAELQPPRADRAVGGRCHPVLDHRGLAVLRRRRRPLQPTGRRVGHGDLAQRRSRHRCPAHGLRTPATGRELVHHSDRGAVYTSLAFGNRAAELGIARSFGSTGDCYDNAAVEAVWATLKRELAWIHGRQTWPTRDLLRSAIFDYVEGFYNPQRTQNAWATVLLPSSKRRQWLRSNVHVKAGQHQLNVSL